MKKYLKPIIILLVLAGLIWTAYYFLKENPTVQQLTNLVFPPSEKIGGQLGEGGQTAGSNKKLLQSLTNEPISDYWPNPRTGEIYYLNENGQVLKILNGSEELINSQTLNKLNKIESSYDGNLLFARFDYPSSPIFSIFDITTSNWKPLSADTISAAWSPNSQELIFATSNSLNIVDFSSQKSRKVLDLTQKDINLSWLSTSTVLITTPTTSDLSSPIWSLNLLNKSMAAFLPDELGLTVKWFKNSDFGIKLNNENRSPRLSLIDKNGSTLLTFTFVTMPSKCLIDKDNIYCAVPKNLPANLKLPEDYYKGSVYFDDTLYLINLSNGAVSELQIENKGQVFDAEHLEIQNGKLLFKNRLNGKLYGLEL